MAANSIKRACPIMWVACLKQALTLQRTKHTCIPEVAASVFDPGWGGGAWPDLTAVAFGSQGQGSMPVCALASQLCKLQQR